MGVATRGIGDVMDGIGTGAGMQAMPQNGLPEHVGADCGTAEPCSEGSRAGCISLTVTRIHLQGWPLWSLSNTTLAGLPSLSLRSISGAVANSMATFPSFVFSALPCTLTISRRMRSFFEGVALTCSNHFRLSLPVSSVITV